MGRHEFNSVRKVRRLIVHPVTNMLVYTWGLLDFDDVKTIIQDPEDSDRCIVVTYNESATYEIDFDYAMDMYIQAKKYKDLITFLKN